MDDLLIRGGLVLDGTGTPGRVADVAIAGSQITEVAPGSARKAKREIDARGQVVAPGFIDIHTHSDYTLPLNPRAESKIRQGVTTEVVGNCGFSAYPCGPDPKPIRDFANGIFCGDDHWSWKDAISISGKGAIPAIRK